MGYDDLKAALNNGALLYFVADGKIGDPTISNVKLVSEDEYNNINTDQYKAKFTLSKLITYGAPAQSNRTETEDNLFNHSRQQRFSALLDNMKNVKYLAPKWQTMRIKNSTDDTGNNVVSQKVSYKSIDTFYDSDTIDENVTTLPQAKKEKIEKFWEQNYNKGKNQSSSQFVENFNNAFDSSYYRHVTKGIFGPNTFKDYMTLNNTTSQTIYDSKFIGYQCGDDNYLLTKAQNDNQKAVFSK